MAISGSTGYNYPGVYGGGPALGSSAAYMGKGPIAAFIVGSSGTIATTATVATTGSLQFVQINGLSGTVIQQTGTFLTNGFSTVFAVQDLSLYSNVAITLVNNHASNALQSCSLEWSPNNSQFEAWDTSTFAGLAANGGIKSMQISSNSRRYFRIRAIPSGSGGAFTGSLDVYVHANLG
jgi:hypothetical protein